MLNAFGCGFKVPKFHVMKDFSRAIKDFGGTDMVSTEYGEYTHKIVKAAYPFNNHSPKSMAKQVKCCSSAMRRSAPWLSCSHSLQP